MPNLRPLDDTIYALASAAGRAGVAVFRVSGPAARAVLEKLCRPATLPAPRRGVLRRIVDAHDATLDHALVLFFPGPGSFTGEDVVELHTHGGRAVIEAVTQALAALPGLRLAEPGEFTRRAFENGKMDLTEAEAIADLVHAETEAQRKQALRQMEGALRALYDGWRERLARALAYIEAAIDFSEEELPPDMIERQSEGLRALRGEILAHLDDKRRGEKLREGFSVVLLGAPNAGKSSLLNALAQREAAIVSPVAGTTRDVIEVHLDLAGYPVALADTAGLRDSDDALESEGVRRARAQAARADLKLFVLDGAAHESAPAELCDADTLLVANKADVAGFAAPAAALAVSARTGAGLDALLQRLADEFAHRFAVRAEAPALTRARHREALTDCAEALARALGAPQIDQRAEDVRLALRALGRITGHVDVEDLLDIIFRDFCIGK